MAADCRGKGFRVYHGLSGPWLLTAGGSYRDAVGVCTHEMGDPQLALFLCQILEGASGPLRSTLLKELVKGSPQYLSPAHTIPGQHACIHDMMRNNSVCTVQPHCLNLRSHWVSKFLNQKHQ